MNFDDGENFLERLARAQAAGMRIYRDNQTQARQHKGEAIAVSHRRYTTSTSGDTVNNPPARLETSLYLAMIYPNIPSHLYTNGLRQLGVLTENYAKLYDLATPDPHFNIHYRDSIIIPKSDMLDLGMPIGTPRPFSEKWPDSLIDLVAGLPRLQVYIGDERVEDLINKAAMFHGPTIKEQYRQTRLILAGIKII